MARKSAKTRPVDDCTSGEVYLTPEMVANLQDRLSRIEGHVRGVKRMLEEQSDCDRILIQLSAIRAAVNQVTIKVLEGHLETCVRECVAGGEEPDVLDKLKSALSQVLKNA